MNITKVSETLYRGPRPESMQPLLDLGIKTVINLETGWFEFFHQNERKERDAMNASRLEYYNLRFSNILFPTRERLRMLINFLSGANHELASPVYVHCKWGHDRTGIVCAAYRAKVQGWSVDDAIAEMYAMGFSRFPYEFPLGWVWALRKYLSN